MIEQGGTDVQGLADGVSANSSSVAMIKHRNEKQPLEKRAYSALTFRRDGVHCGGELGESGARGWYSGSEADISHVPHFLCDTVSILLTPQNMHCHIACLIIHSYIHNSFKQFADGLRVCPAVHTVKRNCYNSGHSNKEDADSGHSNKEAAEFSVCLWWLNQPTNI